MNSFQIVVPSFSGHARHAQNFLRTAALFGHADDVKFILSKDDVPHFAFADPKSILLIEDLIAKFHGEAVGAGKFLKKVGKFKYQSLKKMLGVAASDAEMCLVIDSESELIDHISSDLLRKILVPYRDFSVSENPNSLQRQVVDEANHLLGTTGNDYFFDSYNWFYQPKLMRELISHLERRSPGWLDRPKSIFELQVYFKYAMQVGADGYEFVATKDLLAEAVGVKNAALICERLECSPYRETGVFEYLNCLVDEGLFREVFNHPRVQEANRFRRFETPWFAPVPAPISRNTQGAFGLVSMHRKTITRKMVAVVSGRFGNIDQVMNTKTLLDGLGADVVVITEDSYLTPKIVEHLQPRRLVITDPERVTHLANDVGFTEENLSQTRNLNVLRMLDKLSAATSVIRELEFEDGEEYSTIIRLRPDIYALQSFSRSLFSVAEFPNWHDAVFFPNRMFSLGLNDQVFVGSRNAVMSLFESLTPERVTSRRFFNPEFILGELVGELGLKPLTFNFAYVLGRAEEIHPGLLFSFHHWEHIWWSRTVPFPPNVDLSNYVRNNVQSTYAIASIKATMEANGVTRLDLQGGARIVREGAHELAIVVPAAAITQDIKRLGLDVLPGDKFVFRTEHYNPSLVGRRFSLPLPRRPRNVRIRRAPIDHFRIETTDKGNPGSVAEVRILMFSALNDAAPMAVLRLSV